MDATRKNNRIESSKMWNVNQAEVYTFDRDESHLFSTLAKVAGASKTTGSLSVLSVVFHPRPNKIVGLVSRPAARL